tara:strand:- start:316 stop:432 length:117 start_codon:yes stop_codon:yes gene_type:complete
MKIKKKGMINPMENPILFGVILIILIAILMYFIFWAGR